jgi:hypothetical protein
VSRHPSVLRAFSHLPVVSEIRATGPASVTAGTARGEVTFLLPPPDQAGAAFVSADPVTTEAMRGMNPASP